MKRQTKDRPVWVVWCDEPDGGRWLFQACLSRSEGRAELSNARWLAQERRLRKKYRLVKYVPEARG